MNYPTRTSGGRLGNQLQVYIGGAWRKPVTLECQHCGKDFLYYNRQDRLDSRLYCSNACKGKEHRKELSRRRVWRICPWCKEKIQLSKSRAADMTTCGKRACSLKQWSKAQVKEQARRKAIIKERQ